MIQTKIRQISQNIVIRAFSLVELLLVLAIGAVIISLSMPAFRNMREMSRSTVCISNLRQIGMGLLTYSGDHNGYLPPADLSPHDSVEFPQTNRWPYLAWSHFGLGDPKKTFKKGYNDARYDLKPGARPNIFVCPTTRSKLIPYPGASSPGGKSCYGMSVNPARFFYNNNWTNAPNYSVNRAWLKNASGTALILENQYLVVSSDLYFNASGLVPHRGGMNVLYYDGHVQWMTAQDIPTHYRAQPFWRAN